MNRRDFLLMRTDGSTRILELSCEKLYMRWVDARSAPLRASEDGGATGSAWWEGEPPAVLRQPGFEEILQALESELADTDVLHLRDTEWLRSSEFRDRVESLVSSFRKRGGRVESAAEDSRGSDP